MQEKRQNISPVKHRILQFVDTLGISKREFYQKTGISRGTLESSTGITEETITKVFATYQNLSPSWILTGNGEMIAPHIPEEFKNEKNKSTSQYTIDLKEFRKRNNLTQSNAATYFGCKQAFISQIERKERSIPNEFISKIKSDNKLIWKPIFDNEDETPYHIQNTEEKTNIYKLIESNQVLVQSIAKMVETNSMLAAKIIELTK